MHISLRSEPVHLFDNVIHFEQPLWEQNRPEEFEQIDTCIDSNENSISAQELERMATDERYRRPFVSDFQLSMSKDVMNCH